MNSSENCFRNSNLRRGFWDYIRDGYVSRDPVDSVEWGVSHWKCSTSKRLRGAAAPWGVKMWAWLAFRLCFPAGDGCMMAVSIADDAGFPWCRG